MPDPNGNILVLGASGFAGAALVSGLAGPERSIYAYARAPAASARVGVTHVRGSIEDTALLHEVIAQSMTIIYTASLTTPGTSAHDPVLEVMGNLLPLARVLECANEFPRRHFVYLSSGGTVYGDLARDAVETTPLRPRSYYGAGKAAAEALIRACAATTDWTASVLRPTNLYGPGQATARGFAIVPTLFERALDGDPFQVWGDGASVRDYCYIDDLVDAVRATLAAPPPDGCVTYNVASGCTASVIELIAACETACARPIAVAFRAARSVDVRHVAPSSSAIRSVLGWAPRVDLAAGLARTWRWTQNLRSAGASD
jgi:UDP-glucose 4-epimerase